MKSALMLPTVTASAAVSALQRRLMIAESQPDEDWLNLAENVPVWPCGEEPQLSGDGAGAEAYGYAQSQGVPELIEALVEREIAVSASSLIQAKNIAISSGGLHGLGLVFRECVARGYSRAIYAIPTFIGVHSGMVAAGMSICPVPLTGTESDWDLLSAACGEPTVIYLNLPHNPTGQTATPGYLAMIGAFAASHNVVVVYDAVYDAFRFDAESAPAPIDWAVTSPGVIVVNSVSKNFGRPGDRIGWIVAHEEVIASLVPRIEWEIVCVNPRAQLTAASVIRQGNGPLIQAVRAGRAAFSRRAAGHPILDIDLPGGGTQLWLDLGVDDIEGFADYALLEHHLILTTSANYAPALPGYIRMPTGIAPERIERGVQILGQLLSEWGER